MTLQRCKTIFWTYLTADIHGKIQYLISSFFGGAFTPPGVNTQFLFTFPEGIYPRQVGTSLVPTYIIPSFNIHNSYIPIYVVIYISPVLLNSFNLYLTCEHLMPWTSTLSALTSLIQELHHYAIVAHSYIFNPAHQLILHLTCTLGNQRTIGVSVSVALVRRWIAWKRRREYIQLLINLFIYNLL